uniref:Uncharacterized protein n=1 Tax=Oryza glaberrima TaxID=4538 RepID=I1QT06_ORYGL
YWNCVRLSLQSCDLSRLLLAVVIQRYPSCVLVDVLTSILLCYQFSKDVNGKGFRPNGSESSNRQPKDKGFS